MLNLSTPKNVIPGGSTPPPGAAPSATAALDGVRAEVEKQQRVMFRGKTKAQVERLRDEIDAAALAVQQAERTIGERRADDLDITAATEELRQAGDHLRALQAALDFAIQKDATAQTELLNAERQAAIEKEFEALAFLKLTVGPEIDDYIDLGARLAAKLASAREAASLAGAGGSYNPLASAGPELARFSANALYVATGVGFTPSGFMKYKKWSDCLPDPETARTRRRS